MQVDITEQAEHSKVAFTLEGLNENLEGNGSFQVEEATDATSLIGYLDITGKGMMGSVMNSMMKTYVPETVNALTEAISEKTSQTE